MPIMYRIHKKADNIGTERTEKYYLVAKRWDRVSYDSFIESMVKRTGLTPSEARSAMDYLAEYIPIFLETNNSIDLGPLGRMIVTLKCEGSESKEEASVHKVKDIRLRFIPNKELRQKIRNLPLKKYPEEQEEVHTISYNNAMLRAKHDTEEKMKVETARKCLDEGIDIETTARISGMTIEELKNKN